MPKTSTATHNDRTLTFTEEGHTYTDDLNRNYTSVTTLLHQYAQPFDAQANASRMQAQGRGTATDLIAAWDEKRELACAYGTRVHETAEAILQGRQPPHSPESDKERAAFAAVWEFCHAKILPTLTVLGCEIMVFNPHWCIAGTIDLALRDKDGTIWICDWKTNERIRREGFKGQAMLPPVAHLPDCELSRYSLQLATYQLILTHGGYLPHDTKFRRAIFHVAGNQVEPIIADDLTRDAAAILLDNLVAVPF
jgi:ATP-dependent exoDNAse (exonuclease V) beta subunit